MSERSRLISRLLSERDFRASYIRAKLDVLIPSQLRALRLRQEKTQSELAQLADMKQARISAMETPGLVNFNLETLVRMGATLNLGLMVKFVPFSEMLAWENSYNQDAFNPTQLPNDIEFLQPAQVRLRKRVPRKRSREPVLISVRIAQAIGAISAPIYRTPAPREGAQQMKLQFEQSESLASEKKYADALALANASGSALRDDSLIRKALAASAGAAVWRTNYAA